MTLEIIARSVLSGTCDRCGYVAPLHMTRDETGRQALLCRHCINAEKKGRV